MQRIKSDGFPKKGFDQVTYHIAHVLFCVSIANRIAYVSIALEASNHRFICAVTKSIIASPELEELGEKAIILVEKSKTKKVGQNYFRSQ